MKQFVALLFILLLSGQMAQAQDCTDDCVWPGDLNANGVANYLDFLTFGFCYQSTGPIRQNASSLWEPQDAEDWAGTLPLLGANFKHSDADGNGVIDEMDRLVIAVNYTETNPNFVDFLGNNIEGNDLFAVPLDSIASPGSSLIFDIHLGTEANPISNIYGIGFQLNLDTQYVENVIFDYSDSWIGTDDELLVHDKYSDDHDFLGMAQTRFDGNSVSGFGPIARIEIVITDVILGLQVDTTACVPFPISFENVLGIDENENDRIITNRVDTLGLKHASQIVSGVEDLEYEKATFTLFPNPSNGIVNIRSGILIKKLVLHNQMGNVVWQKEIDQFSNQYLIDFSKLNLPGGLYFITAGNSENQSTQKLFLE